MLELRPNCEYCDKDLPPTAQDARICSYECTFCADCVDGPLRNVCPNCGGGFVPRPVRPARDHRPGVSLRHHPAGRDRKYLRWDKVELVAYVEALADVAPVDR